MKDREKDEDVKIAQYIRAKVSHTGFYKHRSFPSSRKPQNNTLSPQPG
jgi:predicted glycosyltransferase